MSVPKAFPTECILKVWREHGGRVYPRDSLTFGDMEPISVMYGITSFGLPVMNVPIDFYLDDRKVATVRTNVSGEAWYVFSPIPKGTHTIKARWEGDFWTAPCEASATVRIVGMVESTFKTYVDNLTVGPGAVESQVMDSLLSKQIGAVVTRVEADTKLIRYVTTAYVAEEPTAAGQPAVMFAWWAVAAIIAAIAAVLLAYAAAVYVTIAYIVGQYQCGIDGQRFTTCEALREHIVTSHPTVWEKIKDRFECAPPTPPWMWMVYAGMAAVGALLVIELVKAIKR